MTLLSFLLVLHVVIGLVGVMASYAVLMGLLKKKRSYVFLVYSSAVAFVSYIASWLSGGYYYVVQYGSGVKPIIKAGDYPWAHALFTEAKEHLFLFLPVLSFIFLLVFIFTQKQLEKDARYRKAVLILALLTFLLGVYITISGIIISGAVR